MDTSNSNRFALNEFIIQIKWNTDNNYQISPT